LTSSETGEHFGKTSREKFGISEEKLMAPADTFLITFGF
jgi:hypothetical protein